MEKTQPSMAVLEAAPPTSGSNHFLSRFSRRLLAALLALSAVSAFLRFGPNCFNPAGILSGSEIIGAHDVPVYPHPALSDSDSQPPTAEEPSSNRVPLEAHIMSKCPDAQYCLQHLVVPAMEQIHDKVDFRLSFIGSISNDTSGVSCMHGPAECVGNMLILCAANLPFPPTLSSHSYPRTPTIRSLGFANCLISSYERIPEREFVEDCALEHGIDFEAMNKCASRQDDDQGGGGGPGGGGEPDKPSGIALLRRSIQRNLDAGIKKSCTVRLDEQVWCVRDGGLWKDCAEDGEGSSVSVLAEEVERLWKEKN